MLTDDLLELQRIDTLSDQLTRRAATLGEREAATAARDAVSAWEARRGALRARLDELEQSIEVDEHEGAELAANRARLERQLKTVAAPRVAEALMHEIDTIGRRRDELDDRELEHLEQQSDAQSELNALDADESFLRDASAAADAALSAAIADIDAELASIAVARTEVTGRLESAMLERYAELRAQHHGVAVARLVGTRCDGCHLDLSAAELDDVRHTPPGELADCPQCARLLVVD